MKSSIRIVGDYGSIKKEIAGITLTLPVRGYAIAAVIYVSVGRESNG